jgi:hypothetical protein
LNSEAEFSVPFEIIVDPPKRKFFRRFNRALAKLLGVLLVMAGLGASSLPLLFVTVIFASLFSSEINFPEMDADQVVMFLTATVIAVVGLWLGTRLVRGRRRQALFLRRFGYDSASEALSFAVTTAMGQRWRLVTLDDNEIAPIHGSEGKGRTAGVLTWIAMALVVAGLFWLFGGGLAEHLGGITDEYMAEGRGGGFKEMVGRIIGAFLIMLFVGLLVGGMVLIIVAFFGATALFSWSSYRSYKKAELKKSTTIERPDQIEPVVMAILKRSRKILAPRLVVVRVAHNIWKDVVSQLAAASAVVLIDVSETGEGLLWEIENLKAGHSHQWILVGQHDALIRLSAGNAIDGSIEQRLLALLDGSNILAYTGDEPRQMKRFANLLRASLDTIEN